MHENYIMKFFIPYLWFCSVLINIAHCARPIIPDNLHHITPTENEHFNIKHRNCRLICSNQFEGLDDLHTQNGEFNRSSSTGRGGLPFILQSLNNLPGHSASLVGIVFNRTGSFRGIVNRISNLNDVIQGFPHSSEIIITRLEQLRNNPFLRGLLQFGNQWYNNEHYILSEEFKQVANRRLILQETFKKLPNFSGIFTTPMGLILNPFRLFKEAFGNLNNTSNILSQFRILFERLPSLSGIFLRPDELFNHLDGLRNVSIRNSSALFFGPDRGYLILNTLFNRILSQLNLNQSTSSTFLFRFLPFVTNAIKYLPRINTTDNDGILVHSLFNLGKILNNSSLLNKIVHEPFKFHEIPEAINYQQKYVLRFIENLVLSYSGSSVQSSQISKLLNNLYEILRSESTRSRFLNGTDFLPFLNILHHFENTMDNRNSSNLNISEIIDRFSYQINHFYKILSSGRFSNSTRLYPFLSILHYLENAVRDDNSGNLSVDKIINRFSYDLTSLFQVFNSGNNSATFVNSPFLNILHNFSNLITDAVGQTESDIPHSAENITKSNNLAQESIFKKHHHIWRTSKSATENRGAPTKTTTESRKSRVGIGGTGNGGAGSGSIGIGGAGINEKSAKQSSQAKLKPHGNRGETIKPLASKDKNRPIGSGGTGSGGSGSGSIGIGRAGINEKTAKHSSHQKSKTHAE